MNSEAAAVGSNAQQRESIKKQETESIDSIIESHIHDPQKLSEIRRLLYGKPVTKIEVPAAVSETARTEGLDIKAFKFNCDQEQFRTPRIVRIAGIQNSIVEPTTAPFDVQYAAIEAKIAQLLQHCASLHVNIVCLQEAWTMPFAFCTREKHWSQFAESIPDGRSIRFIQQQAKLYNMVIVSPILERDEVHNDTIWNTAVIVGNQGNIIGKHRKNHIPRVGDFNESTYYMEGNTGHPVFDTQFGRIAVNICYGRHHPLNWLGFGLNGAEIVFNPSATVGELSEPMWPIEARNAAIANSYYVVGINRVGTEKFEREFTSGDGKQAKKEFGHFYGSSFIAAPDASRCPGLSRVKDGIIVGEVDLNLCRQVKDKWSFPMTGRLDMYAKLLGNYTKIHYKPQLVRDLGKSSL